MFISKKRLKSLEKRISALERSEEGRKKREDYVKLHSKEGLKKARELLR